MIEVVIIRHHKEKLAKCSLQPLLGQPGFTFHRSAPGFTYDAGGHTLLGLDGDPISPADAHRPLLILDGTWRYLPTMQAQLTGTPVKRTLPPDLRTAYPRVSKLYTDPRQGLASVEALYAALLLMAHPNPEVLARYRWATDFLTLNRTTLPPH